MTHIVQLVGSLGEESIAPFWIPLLAWTGIWVAVALILRLSRRADPNLRYRSAQVLLLALPVGMLVAAALPPSWVRALPSAVAQLALFLTEAEVHGAPVLPSSPRTIPVDLLLGVGVLLAAAVAGASMLRLAYRAHAAQRLLQALLVTEVASDGLTADVSVAAEASNVGRVPRVVATSAEVVPMTLGAWRPVVIVPASLGRQDRRLALIHEFAHVAQRDPLAQVAEAVASAAFAAHPAVRHLARTCSLLRELACDAAVLDLPGVHRPAYAALVHRYAVAGVRPPAHAVGIADGALHVHHRLVAMTHTTHRCSRITRAGLVALLTVVAGGAMTAGRAFAQTPGAIHGTVGEGRTPVAGAIVGSGTVGTAAPIPQPAASHPGRPLLTVVQLTDTNADSALLSALREDPAFVEHRAETNGTLTVWFAFADAAERRAWFADAATLARLDATSR